MGQQQPTAPSYTPPTFQQLQKHVQTIFSHQHQKTDLQRLHQALCAVLDNLRLKIPAEMVVDKMQINLIMLKVFYQPNFTSTILKLINLLVQKLQELHKRNFLLIKRQQLIFLLNISNFILFFTDQKLTQTINSFTYRKDLSQETIDYIDIIQSKDLRFKVHKNLFDNLTPAQAQEMHEILQNILIKLISSRSHILARSSLTLEVISEIQPCLFMLLVKLIKTPFHGKNFASKIRKGSPLKYHLRIGQYFLGQGSDRCSSSVYEPAVMLLTTLIEKNAKNLTEIESQIGSVPSHLFKNIPISLTNTSYHFIAIACLFSLAFVKQGSEIYIRFSFNRIPTMILLISLITEKKVTSPQMTQFLQKICLQTKIGSIQRGFMTMMIEKYNKLIKEKIKEVKRLEQVRKVTSGFANKFLQKVHLSRPQQKPSAMVTTYTCESCVSQILQKYLLPGTQPYTIKYESRLYTITPLMIVQQFERNDEYTQTELKALSERYTYESILLRKVVYQYIDSVQWNHILPKIIRMHNLFGEEVKQQKVTRKRTVGGMPVIRQMYVGDKTSDKTSDKPSENSSMKGSKHKPKLPYLQTQAAQNIYQHTSQDQRAQDFKRQLKATKLVRQEPQTQEKLSKGKNGVSLVFEEQHNGDIQEEIDYKFMTSELQLNKNRSGMKMNEEKVEGGEQKMDN